MGKPGKDYEQAVERFVKTLDSTAKVYWNHKVPDRDTGSPRQCDVWVEAVFGGHYPLHILISCKDWADKLDVGHIGTFCDEIRSTSANLGVIYSRAGFTHPALEKAKANSISCCRLYENQPADLPDSIPIWFYAATPRLGLQVTSGPMPQLGLTTWGDLLKAVPALASRLEEEFSKLEDSVAEHMGRLRTLPEVCRCGLELRGGALAKPISILVSCAWRRYRAKTDAVLVNGSYCFANQDFAGSITGPAIDRFGFHPGPGWEEITSETGPDTQSQVYAVLSRPDFKDALHRVSATPL